MTTAQKQLQVFFYTFYAQATDLGLFEEILPWHLEFTWYILGSWDRSEKDQGDGREKRLFTFGEMLSNSTDFFQMYGEGLVDCQMSYIQ